MLIFTVLILMVLSVSLYDFFVTRAWHEVTYFENNEQTSALRERHRRANSIRKAYNRIMLVIVGGLLAATVSAIFVNEKFGGGTGPIKPLPPIDTVQMTLEAPPLEPIETLPETYKLEGNSVRNSRAQEEQKAEEGKDKPSGADDRPKSTPHDKPPTPDSPVLPARLSLLKRPKNMNDADWEVYKKGEETRQDILERTEVQKKKAAAKEAQDALTKSQNGAKPTKPEQSASKTGTADVDWDHNWRKAHQNNDDKVPTPKYMCDFSGKVVVLVKVNADGTVRSAKALTTNVAGCLIQEAERYALKARFEASSKLLDEGKLTYTFY